MAVFLARRFSPPAQPNTCATHSVSSDAWAITFAVLAQPSASRDPVPATRTPSISRISKQLHCGDGCGDGSSTLWVWGGPCPGAGGIGKCGSFGGHPLLLLLQLIQLQQPSRVCVSRECQIHSGLATFGGAGLGRRGFLCSLKLGVAKRSAPFRVVKTSPARGRKRGANRTRTFFLNDHAILHDDVKRNHVTHPARR